MNSSSGISAVDGRVIWITGLSGAGKSTLALLVRQQLLTAGISCVLLDGDSFRKVIGDNLGHSVPDRLSNAYRLARMCGLLSSQGVNVVCATMSLFPEIWGFNRANLRCYTEIYVRVDEPTLRERDHKLVYKQDRDVVGIDISFKEPDSPDLIIDNTTASGPELDRRAARIIAKAFPEGLP